MKIACLLIGLLLAGCAYVNVPLERGVRGVEERVVEGRGRAKIVVMDVSGIIALGKVGLDRFSKEPSMIARIREELQVLSADPAVAALVVRIDSPGGSVTASDIIHHELTSLRRNRRIPVVACIMDKGLSGGYYVALAADEILAHPTSVVGGVGVISFHVGIDGLLEKWGIEVTTVQSGARKDFWSPLRTPRPGELARMEGVTDYLHRRFLSLLEAGRELPEDVKEEVAAGGLFVAGRAMEMGLIDAVGYLDDAILRARERAGVDEARVVVYRRPGAYGESIFAGAGFPADGLSRLGGLAAELVEPAFRYQVLP